MSILKKVQISVFNKKMQSFIDCIPNLSGQAEELNIVKSSNTTFYTFTPCILLQVPSKR